MIALGYIRRSKKSDGRTISLVEQDRAVREYAAQHGFELKDVISHDGISGRKRVRFDTIESAVQQHRPGAVLVYHLDRLARDVGGLLDYLRSLSARGITVHECAGAGVVDLKSSAGFIVTAVNGVFSELFPIIVAEKTTAALKHLHAAGKRYTNHPPFGFQFQDGRLLEDSEEQRALQIIAQCRESNIGARRTRSVLINAGYTGRMGLATIHRLLQNTSSLGVKGKLPASYFTLPDNS